MRVRIEYLDQNERFASCLPVSGRVDGERSDESGRRWWVIALDEPIEYQAKLGDTPEYKLVRTHHLVVGSRWEEYEVGELEPTSIHILIPVEPAALEQVVLGLDAFDHVAWGMCHTE